MLLGCLRKDKVLAVDHVLHEGTLGAVVQLMNVLHHLHVGHRDASQMMTRDIQKLYLFCLFRISFRLEAGNLLLELQGVGGVDELVNQELVISLVLGETSVDISQVLVSSLVKEGAFTYILQQVYRVDLLASFCVADQVEVALQDNVQAVNLLVINILPELLHLLHCIDLFGDLT